MRLKKRILGSEGPDASQRRRAESGTHKPSRRILEWNAGASPNKVIGSVESMFHEIATGSASPSESWTATPPTESYDDLLQLGLADPRTGLPNQLLLLDRLTQALNRRQRHGGHVAVFHVKVENMDDIIEEFGYSCGELVLSEVSRRMSSVLRTEDTIGRAIGRDLIAVLEIEDEEVIDTLTSRLHSVLNIPFDIFGKDVWLAVRIGLAVASDAESAQDVLARADNAMGMDRRPSS